MVDDAHCNQPMLHGFRKHRSPRGKCEIRGTGPNLWFAVAPALGFQVGSFRFTHSEFAQLMEGYCPQAVTLDAHSRRCNTLPTIIFSDAISLPCGRDSEVYWAYWRTPHVFFYQDGDSDLVGRSGKTRPCAPTNWEERVIHLSHWEAGGGTSSLWAIVVWYPPGTHPCDQIPLGSQPWFPMQACVNDRTCARWVLDDAPEPDMGLKKEVIRLQVGGQADVLYQFGLFPAHDLSAEVLLAASASPSGMGVRKLTWDELGLLWDVPILCIDSLQQDQMEDFLAAVCTSAPAKMLFSGTDALLTTLFRGGSKVQDSKVNEEEEVEANTSPNKPLSNDEIGLKIATVLKLSAVNPPVNPLEPRVNPNPDPNTNSHPNLVVEVVKGEGQKADGASVPTQLWDQAFLRGYGQEGNQHLLRHQLALGIPSGTPEGFLAGPKPPDGWAAALEAFRMMGLSWWRRHVLRGFYAWRKANIGGVSSFGLVSHSTGMRHGKGVRTFVWTAQGRAAYTWQWKKLRSTEDGLATMHGGFDAIRRCANASWFEWTEGSAPFFWNWGKSYQRGVRDGQPHYTTGAFPIYTAPQGKHRDPVQHELMRKKILGVRKREYICPGPVVSGTHYFCVPKGSDDVRMVYNGTSCGLNEVLFAPRFGLPTVRHTLRAILPDYHQADLDVGEQFLNFCLHKSLREYSGVDVREVRATGQEDEEWETGRGAAHMERWVRNWMGLRDSPYRSLQWQVRLKFEVYGNRRDLSNPFHWDKVVWNLPGSAGYRSDLPWVMKLRRDGHLAAEIFVYVDDGRVAAHSEDLAWRAGRAYGAGCSRRGVQDASRKRTSPSQTPGQWAGTVTHTTEGRVVGMVSQEKWDRTKRLIAELQLLLSKGPLPLQRLLEIRGFLMYVVRTYTWLNPYMKGLHLTIDSWRAGRAEDGFKLTLKEKYALQSNLDMACRRESENDAELEDSAVEEEEAPTCVHAVDRFRRDVDCLDHLTSTAEPPKQLYRAKHHSAFFVIGDASGKGKGNAVLEQYGVDYESGLWNRVWSEKSSNCREAENLTDRLERLGSDHSLQDHEVFLITDNSAFEGAYYKGHSQSRELSDIVFRVHKAQRDGGFILHVIHISGKRMKASGVDGLSRGDLTEGMMAGKDPLSYIPFHKGADERSGGKVSVWVRSWWTTKKGKDFGGFPLVAITKESMFGLRDLKAARLWIPPPTVMEVALELLCEDRLAHPQWPHVFVVPRFFTHLWRKDLMKDADVFFTVPANVPFWTSGQFEPLIVAIILPHSHVHSYSGPWLVKGTDVGQRVEQALRRGFKCGSQEELDGNDAGELHDLEGKLCEVWESPESGSRTVLQQLLAWASKFPPVQECLVWRMLSGSKRRSIPTTGRQSGSSKRQRSRSGGPVDTGSI